MFACAPESYLCLPGVKGLISYYIYDPREELDTLCAPIVLITANKLLE